MNTKLTIGQYFTGDSTLHRLDPRVKITLTIAYMALVFLASGWAGYGIVAAFMLGCIWLSGVPIRMVLRSLRPLLYIIIFTFVLNILFTQTGTEIFKFWIIRLTDEGLVRSVQMALRLAFLVMGTSLLTLTTSPIQLTDGMEALLSPLKRIGFPAHEMAMMMTIALRFIPTLLDEADKIMKAQMARGADFESGNLIERARGMVPLLVPLFISAVRRADELAMAMESRCYCGGDGRTRMTVLKAAPRDAYAAAAVVAVGVLLVLV